MRYLSSRPRAAGAFIGIVAGASIVGGVAYASIPNSHTGVISGCISKATGATRIIDSQAGRHCTNKERAISWNAQGPAGPPGAPGNQGPSGIGPAISAWHNGGVSFTAGSSDTTIMTVPIAQAGSYVISANATLMVASGGQQWCTLSAGGDSDFHIFQVLPNGEWTTISFQVVHTFTTSGSILLTCNGNGTPGATEGALGRIKVTAIQVSSLTNTPL